MKIMIFDKLHFEFKEELSISSDYQIILDVVINQNCYFVTNNNRTKAIVGDIIILHERSFFYIGSVSSIETTDIGQIKINSMDYLSSIDFDLRVSKFTGNIGNELIRYLRTEYSDNIDSYQNKPFLKFENQVLIEGNIQASSDDLVKFSDIYKDIYKQYKIRLHVRLGIVNGMITHIKIVTVDATKEHVLSSNFPMIRGLIINDNLTPRLNKMTFVPSIENIRHTSVQSFYLLDDGSITTERNAPGRLYDVIEQKRLYKDDELGGELYLHLFSSGQVKTASGTISLSGISWIQSSATHIGFDSTVSARGVQIGSSSNPNTQVFYLQTALSGLGTGIKVTEVKITLATASIQNEYKIQVGQFSTNFKIISSLSNATYTTGKINESSGNIEISLRATSGAMYISKIEISYQAIENEKMTLLDIASQEMLKEEYMHHIAFSIAQDNSVFVPFQNVHLGDKVLFIHGEKRWITILSRIEMKGSVKDYMITLGEQRIKLTEKLRLILEGK